jgi:hypothetical protein
VRRLAAWNGGKSTPLSSAATMNMPRTGSTAPLTLLGQWKQGASEKMLMPRVIVGYPSRSTSSRKKMSRMTA